MKHEEVEEMCCTKCMTLAAFPSTYFYVHFRISHKKLHGNGKMCINSKNVFFLKQKITMETHLANKSLHAHQKIM